MRAPNPTAQPATRNPQPDCAPAWPSRPSLPSPPPPPPPQGTDGNTYLANLNWNGGDGGSPDHAMEHLTCFVPGWLALGARWQTDPKRKARHMKLAEVRRGQGRAGAGAGAALTRCALSLRWEGAAAHRRSSSRKGVAPGRSGSPPPRAKDGRPPSC
jgi:hypothetical protein